MLFGQLDIMKSVRCSNIKGLIPNDASCFCGKNECTPTSGLFCSAPIHMCANGPLSAKKQRISVERCRMFVRNGGGIKLRLKGLCTVVLYKCDLSQLFQKIKDDEQDS